ncbi:MAG: hypothetical protein AB1757_06225 [Acidobacteriota bacterium]
MLNYLTDFYNSLTWSKVLIGFALFLATFTLSLAMVSFVLVKIPPTYFHPTHNREFMVGKPWLVRWGGLILKNIAGVLLVAIGIILSLPGVPGQGILTILLGLVMIDIPGKRPMETRIVRRPAVLSSINKLRARFGKPPLEVE